MKEWSTTVEIARLLGKTTRRVQQLTQEGILKAEVPPGGGVRRYNTRETLQRYRDTAGKADAQRHNDAEKLLAMLDMLPPESRRIVMLMVAAFMNGMAAQENIDTKNTETRAAGM